jgi:hypothetical protein
MRLIETLKLIYSSIRQSMSPNYAFAGAIGGRTEQGVPEQVA